VFRGIGLRLALLNALVVVGVIAVTGLTTFVLLRRALDVEEERSIRERVERAAVEWAPLLAAGQAPPAVSVTPVPMADDDEDEDHDDEEHDKYDDDDLLETSDTFLFGFDRSGALIVNERGISVAGLPDPGAVHAALDGRAAGTTLRLDDHSVRIWTEPVYQEGELLGVVQGVRGTGEHESQRRQVLLFTGLGALIGALVAVPAGWLLSGRAMRPIEAAFQRQRRFVSDASHELRTPLTLIRAQAELIARSAGERGDLAGEANVVRDEVDRMSRLVDDLVLLARMDERPAPPDEMDPIELAALVEQTVAAFEPAAASAGITLAVELGRPLVVRGDPDALRRAIRNLIDNAVRYTPRGGEVRVSGDREGDEVVVRVADTGIGLTAAERDRVFDRFYRTDRARDRASGGTGLGLAIVRALVEGAGGRVGVESRTGAGSVFWFALPATDPDANRRR
jgi:signal transduction histidine kinase